VAIALAACASPSPPRPASRAAGLSAAAAAQPGRPPRRVDALAPAASSTEPRAPAAPPAVSPAAPGASLGDPSAAAAEGDARGASQGPSIAIDPPYKLGRHLVPRGQAEVAEQNRWNVGGRGDPPAPPPPTEGHPLPRIIVDIDHVKGPLKASEVQRIARRHLWIHVYSCYRLRAYRDPTLHGKTTVRLTVSRAGKVTGARATSSTLSAPDVVSCLAARARSLPLPRAKAGSTVTATLQVYPGDEPVEPPPSVLAPGPGELPPDAISAALAEALPAWRSCYEEALAGAPALWGRLAIRFHVTDSGAVDEAFEAESRFPDERLTRCVLRRARALTFPAPEGGDLRFVVPLRFSPDPQPSAP
jgi:hypothetical protein